MLYSTVKNDNIFPPDIYNDSNKKNLVIGNLKRGEYFGEDSALNDTPTLFAVEATSPRVELYMIHRA